MKHEKLPHTLIHALAAGALLAGLLACSDESEFEPELPFSYMSASPTPVKLSGASEEGFNPLRVRLQFDFPESSLQPESDALRLELNGVAVANTLLQITEHSVALEALLVEGRNDIVLYALDEHRQLIYKAATLWAGSQSLRIYVTDENNKPADGATVIVKLGDDPAVRALVTTVGGVAEITQVPNRTVVIEASATENRFASVATTGNARSTALKLRAFNSVNSTNNNNFSQGTAGWEIGSAPVRIVSHVEGTSIDAPRTGEVLSQSALSTPSNNDLLLDTHGEGSQTISRTFTVPVGTKEVKVRYKYITSEIPGGYFGSRYNDYYNVSLRTRKANSARSDSQTMNGLGRAAFDSSGATSWREIKLATDPGGDIVQVDATVANVADGLYNSQLIIDEVSMPKVTIENIVAVVKGATGVINVSMDSVGTPVTLVLNTVMGTGKAVFATTNTSSMTMDRTSTVVVKGILESSKHDNIRLTAQDKNGTVLDTEDLSVLWVNVSLRSGSGWLSQDNAARPMIRFNLGNEEIGMHYNNRQSYWSNTVEFVGAVSPPDFPEVLTFRRQLIEGCYYQKSLKTSAHKLLFCTTNKDDTSQPVFRDDDPQPNGCIYDADGPGIPGAKNAAGVTLRQRANYRQYVEYQGKPCSSDLFWFARISIVNGDAATAIPDSLAVDVSGDNQAGEGSTPLSWDLK